MRRTLASALAASLLALGAAGQVQAQDMTGRTAPLFDIAVSAGGAWSSNWFQVGDEGFKPGVAPIFGLGATFWLSPTFGIRANGQYMPSKLPQDGDTFTDDRWVMNNYFYGLDLMWRPMFWSNPGWMGSMYVFLGGGGLTTNIAGDGGCLVYAGVTAAGVCLPVTPTRATVGQGEAGLGFDLFPLFSGVGLFLEGGVHGYDSPAHVAENAQNADDAFSFTPYAVLGLKLGFGNIIPPPPPPPPVIPPPPPPQQIVPPPPPPVETQSVTVCTVQNGQLSNVTATYNPATGDTTGLPTAEQNAASATWYINNEPITFNGRRYVKYGLPRVLGATDVNNVGNVQGVAAFAEPSANAEAPEVIYVPVGSRCEFQPYQIERKAGAVRG
ncbi:MAG TPA: hypothetical protein VGB15_12030 [Longimicrobium sp.]|jgi:hypothetical protein